VGKYAATIAAETMESAAAPNPYSRRISSRRGFTAKKPSEAMEKTARPMSIVRFMPVRSAMKPKSGLATMSAMAFAVALSLGIALGATAEETIVEPFLLR